MNKLKIIQRAARNVSCMRHACQGLDYSGPANSELAKPIVHNEKIGIMLWHVVLKVLETVRYFTVYASTCFIVIAGLQSFSSSRIDRQTVPEG